MADTDSGPWEALWRAYAVGPNPALAPIAPDPPSAVDAAALGVDLAEERAAIMEYDGGLSRAEAEARAFAAHSLPIPSGR